MTVHRVRICRCGHEEALHEGGTGRCLYGHDHVMGGCDCPRFGRRRRAEAATAPVRDPLVAAIDDVVRALGVLRAQLGGRVNEATSRSVPEAVPRVRETPRHRSPSSDGAKLRAGERRILEVAARHHPVRLTRAQLATLARFAAKGGTFQTYLSVLRRDALLEERDGLLGATSKGLSVAGVQARQPMTREEIVATWRAALRAGERTMLDLVLRHGALTRAQLGELARIEPRGGTFGTYLSVLRRNGLVAVEGQSVKLGKALAEAR